MTHTNVAMQAVLKDDAVDVSLHCSFTNGSENVNGYFWAGACVKWFRKTIELKWASGRLEDIKPVNIGITRRVASVVCLRQ